MTIDFDRLALMPCVAVFGQPVTYIPGSGAEVPLFGIYNRYTRDEKIDDLTGAAVVETMPTVAIRRADLPAATQCPDQGGGIVVDGTTFVIVDVIEDGFGQMLLKLMRPQA